MAIWFTCPITASTSHPFRTSEQEPRTRHKAAIDVPLTLCNAWKVNFSFGCSYEKCSLLIIYQDFVLQLLKKRSQQILPLFQIYPVTRYGFGNLFRNILHGSTTGVDKALHSGSYVQHENVFLQVVQRNKLDSSLWNYMNRFLQPDFSVPMYKSILCKEHGT